MMDSETSSSLLETLQGLTAIVEKHATQPYGPPVHDEIRKRTGEACVTLCNGDQDRARSLWKVIVKDLGYMPHSAAWTLIRAAATDNLVPDIEAPDPT